MSEEPIRGGCIDLKTICVMIAIVSLALGVLLLATNYPSTIKDWNTYNKMKMNMNSSQQVTQGIVTDMDCYCAYWFDVTIGGENHQFDITGECVPLLKHNNSYTIYWHWDVVEYCAGGCCRYAKYVNYIEDENGGWCILRSNGTIGKNI